MSMIIKLENESGDTYYLPEGFAIEGIDFQHEVPMTEYAGRSHVGIDAAYIKQKKTNISIVGKLLDCSGAWQTDAETARREALDKLREIIAFCAEGGVLRIWRETTEVVANDSLNWHIEAVLSKVSTKFLNGAFKGTVQQISIDMIRTSPYWQGDFKKYAASGSILNGATLSLSPENEGTVKAYPLIMLYSAAGFTMPTGKDIIIAAGIGGTRLVKWSGALAADSYLIFDTRAKQIYQLANADEISGAEGIVYFDGLNGENKMASVTDMGKWAIADWGIEDADTITVTSNDNASASLDVSLEIRFREQYY